MKINMDLIPQIPNSKLSSEIVNTGEGIYKYERFITGYSKTGWDRYWSTQVHPRKRGHYLLLFHIPAMCEGGTSYLEVVRNGSVVQQYALNSSPLGGMCTWLPNLKNGETIAIDFNINNSRNYSIQSYKGISIVLLEIF